MIALKRAEGSIFLILQSELFFGFHNPPPLKPEKYVEPAKTLSLVLLSLLVVAWKVHSDDSDQLANLKEARQIVAEWFFYDINLTQLSTLELGAGMDQGGKAIDSISFPLPTSARGESRELGSVGIKQTNGSVIVTFDPKSRIDSRMSLFFNPEEGDRLLAPRAEAVTWSYALSKGKAVWMGELFAARRRSNLSDLQWDAAIAVAANNRQDTIPGLSERSLKLSTERLSAALALDALYRDANIGASPREKFDAALIAARSLKGDYKEALPSEEEEKEMLGQEFNLLDKHYRESSAKIPLIELDAQPPLSLFVLTLLAVLCVVVIRSSVFLMLRAPERTAEEVWPVFDSPDATGRFLGAVWIIVIASSPFLIASIGCINTMYRVRMGLTPSFWLVIFMILSLFGVFYGWSAGLRLRKFMAARWLMVDKDAHEQKPPNGQYEA